MNNKPYRLGILVGRFQTLHSGHTDMINRAIELCDKVEEGGDDVKSSCPL